MKWAGDGSDVLAFQGALERANGNQRVGFVGWEVDLQHGGYGVRVWSPAFSFRRLGLKGEDAGRNSARSSFRWRLGYLL